MKAFFGLGYHRGDDVEALALVDLLLFHNNCSKVVYNANLYWLKKSGSRLPLRFGCKDKSVYFANQILGRKFSLTAVVDLLEASSCITICQAMPVKNGYVRAD